MSRVKRVHSYCGAPPYSGGENAWPAWYSDAITVVEVERIKEHNSRQEAESSQVSL